MAKESAEVVFGGSLHLDFVKPPSGDILDKPGREETFDSQRESVVSINYTSLLRVFFKVFYLTNPMTHD